MHLKNKILKNKMLIAYRKLLNKNQREFAEAVGIKYSTYVFKERGTNDFTHTEITKIVDYIKCEYPNITANDVFFNSGVIKTETA
jgi:DNA-binding XRE family transcriptional regulator